MTRRFLKRSASGLIISRATGLCQLTLALQISYKVLQISNKIWYLWYVVAIDESKEPMQ